MPDLRPWLRVKARYEAGEFVPLHVRLMAEEALGEAFVRRLPEWVAVRSGVGERPDFRDREAGDDSFSDDGGPVLL